MNFRRNLRKLIYETVAYIESNISTLCHFFSKHEASVIEFAVLYLLFYLKMSFPITFFSGLYFTYKNNWFLEQNFFVFTFYWYYHFKKSWLYLLKVIFYHVQIPFKSCNCFHLFSIAISLSELFERKIILSSCEEFFNFSEVLHTRYGSVFSCYNCISYLNLTEIFKTLN